MVTHNPVLKWTLGTLLALLGLPMIVKVPMMAIGAATGEKASQITPPLRVGQVLDISFPTFTPRITINSERELTVKIVAGDNIGFSDTVEYEAVAVRDGLVVLSWREHIGSTIVHVLDLNSSHAYTAVTPAKGGFMRLKGRIEITSAR
jgi:molybdenum cofactor biosynthesis MoaF-like protein